MDTTRRLSAIIVKAYGRRYNLKPHYEPKPSVWETLKWKLQALWPDSRNTQLGLLVSTITVLSLGASIYYFNTILAAEHEMRKSWAQVEVLLQRRNDLSVNLAKAVQDYSLYERQVLAEVVRLRVAINPEDLKADRLSALGKGTNKALPEAVPTVPNPEAPSVQTSPDTTTSLARLLAIGEQYPDLKLSANFQNLMVALVEVEKDLAGERFKFNNAVKDYWGYVASIPSNVFARLFGFRDPTYFKATDEARTLRPIAY